MTNLQQRRRAMETVPSAPTDEPGYWRAGTKLRFADTDYPRGATVPASAVRSLAPGRLHVLMSNRMLEFVLGEPGPNAPAAVAIDMAKLAADDAAIAAAQKENMLRNGVCPEFEKITVGSSGRLPQGHPSTAVPRET
jgi:hypothetical protein